MGGKRYKMVNMGNINTNNQVISIDRIHPNPWNPKLDFNTNGENKVKYERIKKSLEANGQEVPIQVRQKDGEYEIVNGFHRFMAAKELGWEEIEIKDLGVISDSKAKAKTIAYEEAQVPVDRLMVSELVRDILAEDESNLDILPYSAEEAETLRKLVDFDFSSLQNDLSIEPKEDKHFILVPTEHWQRWLDAKTKLGCDTDLECLLLLLSKAF